MEAMIDATTKVSRTVKRARVQAFVAHMRQAGMQAEQDHTQLNFMPVFEGLQNMTITLAHSRCSASQLELGQMVQQCNIRACLMHMCL